MTTTNAGAMNATNVLPAHRTAPSQATATDPTVPARAIQVTAPTTRVPGDWRRPFIVISALQGSQARPLALRSAMSWAASRARRRQAGAPRMNFGPLARDESTAPPGHGTRGLPGRDADPGAVAQTGRGATAARAGGRCVHAAAARSSFTRLSPRRRQTGTRASVRSPRSHVVVAQPLALATRGRR